MEKGRPCVYRKNQFHQLPLEEAEEGLFLEKKHGVKGQVGHVAF